MTMLLMVCFIVHAAAGAGPSTVRDVLADVRVVEIPGRFPVEQTVAREFTGRFAPSAEIRSGSGGAPPAHTMRIRVAGGEGPGRYGFQVSPDGTAELTASHPHLLYAALCRLDEEWAGEAASAFVGGRAIEAHVPWLEGEDGVFSGRPRYVRGYDPEATIRELARLGCSHVSVNVLAPPSAIEEGPPGEIYYRFYDSSPDLDQFVETDLNRGIYPPEYLEANLNLLKENARLAAAYGLTPGLKVCAPRSMPEAFFDRYPYLRGARVDHPYRSYRPRFTATLSHPVVRWHYAELMRRVMDHVPELGYLYLWTNDSGSGFEYVSTLYAGRNGGAYLIREWKTDSAIARAAGENVLRYLRLLRDAASETNPEFRVIAALSWFGDERGVILNGLGNRLDLHIQPGDAARETWPEVKAVERRGSALFSTARAATNFVLGTPCPWLVGDRLREAEAPGVGHLAVTVDPPSLAPWDINREVVRAFQAGETDIDRVAHDRAVRWAGPEEADTLVRAWRLADRAIRAFPDVPLYGTSWAFPLYRHWVRPFVPDIQRIPEKERAYYERHMIATFNNPTLIDFGADALWLLIDREQAASIVKQCDEGVWEPLDGAIAILRRAGANGGSPAVVRDQHDRLAALRCYFRTLRNIGGWIAGMQGYLQSPSPEGRASARRALAETVDDEIANAEALLELWRRTPSEVIPIGSQGESFAMYGDNLGELLEKKIALMRAHRDDEPAIDPEFMWRTGSECPVPLETYRGY